MAFLQSFVSHQLLFFYFQNIWIQCPFDGLCLWSNISLSYIQRFFIQLWNISLKELLRWHVNPNEKSNKYKSSFLSQVTYKSLNGALSSRKCSIKALAICNTSIYVLINMYLPESKFFPNRLYINVVVALLAFAF